jgi:hypothetical protein
MSMAGKFIKARFRFDGAAVFPILNLQYDEDSYSWGLAQIVRKFVAGKKDVSADDLKDWHGEFERLSEAGRYFFSTTDTSSRRQNRLLTHDDNVCFWHLADIPSALPNVCFRG